MSTLSNLTDLELVSLLKKGDHVAYTEIFERYWHVLYLHACKMLHNEDLAADLVQDIFTMLWQRSAELDLHSALKPYLYTCTRNSVLKEISRGKLKDRYATRIGEILEQGVNTTESDVAFRDLSSLLEKEVDGLPPRMKAIFVKSRQEGLSHKIIAEELQISEKTVKSSINRTLHILRSKLTSLVLTLF